MIAPVYCNRNLYVLCYRKSYYAHSLILVISPRRSIYVYHYHTYSSLIPTKLKYEYRDYTNLYCLMISGLDWGLGKTPQHLNKNDSLTLYG